MARVFVTGLGFITSIGNDSATVERNLRDLRHGIEPYAPFAAAGIPVKVSGTVKGFDTISNDPEEWTLPAGYAFKRELLRSMSPHVLYASCALQQAIADARLAPADVSNDQTGLYAASAGSPRLLAANIQRMHQHGVMRCPPLAVVASIAGAVQFNLVAHWKIKGSSTGFASACASSAHALGFAVDDIALGRQDRMFVVGAEDGNVETILPFASMRALSLNPDPATASRPFDAARDGFVGTGGGVVLVLESEAEVLRRGVQPYCEILGWGQASDGHNVAMSHPEGLGLASAMRRCLAASRLTPADLDYVNAHATSTPIGDASECRALHTVLGHEAARVAVSSTKALTGHGLSLAGAMESAFCALALKRGFIPGSAHIAKLDPVAAGLNIPRTTESASLRTVLNNSSGFGGANVAVAFSRVV
ncbi:MAG: beta-ketoacyl-[acyl-carrier-protein] synthase family protein [Verrucomicrobia bacterium]|nr:beta-ketoacyl-[acyl-carrier-protein] synthase family protein [Verrucomicrobiota bacterium]